LAEAKRVTWNAVWVREMIAGMTLAICKDEEKMAEEVRGRR